MHTIAVNRKFAQAARAEASTKDPIGLIEDYHFALLPQMIREAPPVATIIMFWHVAWPNPEYVALCPWRDELLTGSLIDLFIIHDITTTWPVPSKGR